MSNMYVSLSEEDKIAIFDMDDDTGQLDLIDLFPLKGKPGPLSKHPNNNFIYAGCRGSNKMVTLSRDTSSGQLSKLSEIDLRSDPCYISTDETGRYLLAAYYRKAGVSVHPIDNEFTIIQNEKWTNTAIGAHCIQTDRSNKFAFVPHISEPGPSAIFQFKFNEQTGTLTPNQPNAILPANKEGPRHFCFHPNQDVLFTSNEQGSSVTVYDFDVSNGFIRPKQTVSTLPKDYHGDNSCSQIQITPSGKYLYAPNRGHNTIAAFSVNNSGSLEPIGHTSTEKIPRAFTIDPSGNYLYAAGLESGFIACYRINEKDGSLIPLYTSKVGAGPMWVLITPSK